MVPNSIDNRPPRKRVVVAGDPLRQSGAAITLFVLVEKLLAGSVLSRVSGVVMICAGLLYLQLNLAA